MVAIVRSLPQNSLLWAIYDQILTECREVDGFTKHDLHDFFLLQHFGEERRCLFGRWCAIPKRRSSRLNKQEFSDFVESILAFMAQRGVTIEIEEATGGR